MTPTQAQKQAAALDPRCWVHATLTSGFSIPSGKSIHIMSSWVAKPSVQSTGVATGLCHRYPHRDHIMTIPGPFSFDAGGTFSYLDLDKVMDEASEDFDARYLDDPEGLLGSRLDMLDEIVPRVTSVKIDSGVSLIGASAVYQSLDWTGLSETAAVATDVMVESGAWCLLLSAGNEFGLNLFDENGDVPQSRGTQPINVAFFKNQLTKIRVQGASASGIALDTWLKPNGQESNWGRQTNTAWFQLWWRPIPDGF